MSGLRLIATLLALTLLLAACGRGEEPAAYSGPGNPLLTYVPADAPYLAGNLDPTPEAVVDTWLQRLQPVLVEMQRQLTQSRAHLEQGANDGSAADPAERVALALLRELDGKLSRDGLAALGLDIPAHRVLYGVGAFPVFRLSLSDPALLRASLQRILDDAGLQVPEQSFQGRSYWRLGDGRPDLPVALYVAILDDHLAAGILPPSFEDEWLAAFLGLAPATDSNAAQDRLIALNQAEGYTPFGSGLLDLHRLVDEFLQPETLTARVMAEGGHYDPAAITDQCRVEFHAIVDNGPRMFGGITELSPSTLAYRYRLETPSELGEQLLDLVPPFPEADPLSERLLEFAFGLRVGAARDFLREKAEAIVAEPYQCEHLKDVNDSAQQALEHLNQPLPPFVNNFRGLRLSLNAIPDGLDSLPAEGRGLLALHVEQPQMFVGMAQMFLPDLSSLQILPGEPPVRLPESLLPFPDVVAFAAMSEAAIGLSLGAGEEAALPEFLSRGAGPEGTFLTADYDTATYLEYSSRLAAYGMSEAHGHEGMEAIAASARQAFQAVADRSRTTLRFEADGLVADGRMTFR